MRKLFTIATLVLALSAGGCASSAEGLFGLPAGTLTKSVQNPVTKADLYRVENGMRLAVAGLQEYKNLCNAETIAASCIGVVQKMQSYVHIGRPYLKQLRTFVRKNDQVNAAVVYNTLMGILQQVRNEATAAGVNIPTGG